jgi:E3 SUMO-protein ligase RanBP2
LNKVDSGSSFASLASGSSSSFLTKKSENDTGFVGLTIKEDIFTKLANKKGNEDEGHDEGTADDNYDPHYDPIIKLPDEIEVRTGEEDEEKIFGERAKLYRWSEDTKEWKERGKVSYSIHKYLN